MKYRGRQRDREERDHNERIMYRYRYSRKKGRQEVGGEGHKEVPDDAGIMMSDRGPFFGDRTAARRQCTQQTGVKQMKIVPVTAQHNFETKVRCRTCRSRKQDLSTSPTELQRLPKFFLGGVE